MEAKINKQKVYVVNEESAWDNENTSWDAPRIFKNAADALKAFNEAVAEADRDWCERFGLALEEIKAYSNEDIADDGDVIRGFTDDKEKGVYVYDSYQNGWYDAFHICITLREITVE